MEIKTSEMHSEPSRQEVLGPSRHSSLVEQQTRDLWVDGSNPSVSNMEALLRASGSNPGSRMQGSRFAMIRLNYRKDDKQSVSSARSECPGNSLVVRKEELPRLPIRAANYQTKCRFGLVGNNCSGNPCQWCKGPYYP